MAVINKTDFCMHIEKIIAKGDEDAIDATLSTCKKFNVDVEMVKELLNRSVIEKIELAAQDLTFFKKINNSIPSELFA